MKNLGKMAALLLTAVAPFTASAVKFTINVEHPEQLKCTVTQNYEGTIRELVAGDNEFDLEQYDNVALEVKAPWDFKSITCSNGSEEGFYNGTWTLYVYDNIENNVYTVKLKNLDEARTASCTVFVDDPSRVSAQFDGTFKPIAFNAGENTVKFDPENEKTMILSSTDWQKQIYEVTLDGTPVPSNGYGGYNVPLTQGCKIIITALVPDKDITVTFVYTDEGAKGAINNVSVDGTPIEFNGETVAMKAGQIISFNNDPTYSIDGMKINGQVQYWAGNWAYSYTAMDNTEIEISAHKLATYKATVKINDPSRLILYRGYQYNNDIIELTGEETVVEVSEANPLLSWKAAFGSMIDSCIIDNNETTDTQVTVTDGMVIEFVLSAIHYDNRGVVWFDDYSAVSTNYFEFSSTVTREVMSDKFQSGYNVIEFNSDMNPFGLSYYTSNPIVGKIYVDGELASPLYEGSTNYQLNLVNNSVVKMFVVNEPVDCQVNFTVADPSKVTVTRDLIVNVDNFAEGFTCFQGTQVVVAVDGENPHVLVNGNEVAGENGSFTFAVADPETNVVVTTGTAGVEVIEESMHAPVYNLQGVRVGNSLKDLPAGLYIQGGKKIRK